MVTIRTTPDFAPWIADALLDGLIAAGHDASLAATEVQAHAARAAEIATGIAAQFIAARQSSFLAAEFSRADAQESDRLAEVAQLLAFYASTPDSDPGKYTADMAARDQAGIKARAEDARSQARIAATEMARDAELIEAAFQSAYDATKDNAAEICA